MTKTDRIFLDTNILVYAFSRNTPKAEIAERCLRKSSVVSVQVLNEFVDVGRRKYRNLWSELQASLDSVHAVCEVVPVTLEMHSAAIKIAAVSQLRIYDACIFAAAQTAGCEEILSEDLNAGQRFGTVMVRNPFI